MRAIAFDGQRFSEIGPECLEGPIGENPAVAINAENRNLSAGTRRTCITPQYGAGGALHSHEPSSVPLWAIGYSQDTDYGPAGASGIASSASGKP